MRLALQKILYTNVSQLFLSVHLVDESADDFVVFLNEIDLEREIAILLLDYGNSQSNYQYLFIFTVYEGSNNILTIKTHDVSTHF